MARKKRFNWRKLVWGVSTLGVLPLASGLTDLIDPEDNVWKELWDE